MIRLPSTSAAITAPLVASNTLFPGIPIGQSLLDGREFRLSPVQAPASLLPSTNSLALGGLGSGKSTTAKTRIRREILAHAHQAVVIDSFGEDSTGGEWAPLVRSLGGRVIEAGSFALNPCSGLFPPEVREQLVRSLIAAVEPGALTHQATHALQHALNHPKAGSLNGLVDALVSPQDGRWPAGKLTEWGEGAAIALSRYTEGSLRGLFDGPSADLPETDLPILSFDFSRLDRNSPAIPSLMAAVACWAEHVWLRRSTARHRHLVLEEAWQILLSPATAELIQRLLKNSRKAALSLDVVMHTLSDLGTGRAQDLAKLCEIAHVGRLGPEEAALVGALLGLPEWAIGRIPTLEPGQAVWKVGPAYVDIVQTVLNEEETALTDTSARRRRAQQSATPELTPDLELAADADDDLLMDDDQGDCLSVSLVKPKQDRDQDPQDAEGHDCAQNMPPKVIDMAHVFDTRHANVLQAARAARFSEAADLATVGERADITAYGLTSNEAVAWLVTRAQVAELGGNAVRAAQLRAAVTRLGKDLEWFEPSADRQAQDWHRGPVPPTSALTSAPIDEPTRSRRRVWPYAAAIAALSITAAGVWQQGHDDQQTRERPHKVVDFKGRSGAALRIDGVHTTVVAQWNDDRDQVVIQLRSNFDKSARLLEISGEGKKARSVPEDGWYPKSPEIALPVTDALADVTVQIQVGGRTWADGKQATARTVRLSPSGIAYDDATGERLPSDL
ncbi:hypothetical protein ACFV19_33455 [Streptomyces griseoluteus]|uniref:hypothetical protein n=1 Tax=Streptomyces griseoluteus TaxID=29306 RepID=UPI0036A274DD